MSSDQRRLADRYVLDAPIGRGGMGEVWRATDTVLGRQVAVKTIDLGRVTDESAAARFEREARVTAALSHPNVVTVHDTGVEGDTAYLVMELLPGPSLADRLQEGPLPVEDVVEVGRQVASALDAAHARGLVHRDIKPGNIVAAADGRVRVVDFGITQLGEAGAEQALTATHTVMGTAEYLAPEQATGGRVDGRADLYALGCVLFALLTGEPPFRGATPVATMMQHAHDPVPDVRTLRPDTPAWLAALVTSLLAKDPDDRPAGAAGVLESLESRTAPGGVAGAAAAAGAGATAVLQASGAEPTQRLAVGAPPPYVPAPVATPPPAGPGRPPERRRGSSGPLWVLVLVALLALGLLAWKLFGDTATPVATPSSTPSSSAPATSSAPAPTTQAPPPSSTPTPTPTPSATADPGQAVTDARAALLDEVRALQQEGTLDKDAQKTFDAAGRDIDKALRDRDAGALRTARDKLVQDYTKAVQDGKIPQDAASRLDPLVQSLSDAVDAYQG
ncbi:serine/threonine-protein kinase [Phycicoccus duodecadis]|uniref:non-specific serine/threonine protein kinase n=1 Tax=Phycicoccus duodecadis TaxID=173053 RepID=A0A2N3YEP2_9MICO|nr:serine/threonine-protein kinase [Phycicoccus duodecadis]PKW25303.1 serine/threonine-protein kinase [Phycicoccus duodecadis]